MCIGMFGLPGPLRTPFELKIELPTPNFTPDAATLTLHDLNLLKMSETYKYVFEVFQTVQKVEMQ